LPFLICDGAVDHLRRRCLHGSAERLASWTAGCAIQNWVCATNIHGGLYEAFNRV
jgi:hypothetical protein